MTREQFLIELENLLYNLKQKDRENAVQFYKEYFEDAGKGNEQNLIEELGDPKKLAEEITTFYKSSYEKENIPVYKKLENNIETLKLDIASADVYVSESNADTIEYKTENISEEDIKITVEDGEFCIEERPLFSLHKKAFSDFFKNIGFNPIFDETLKLKRKICIFIPKNINLEKAELNIKLGSLKMENTAIQKIEGYTSCGNMDLLNSSVKKIILNASAGSIYLASIKPDFVKVQSSAGNIKMENINTDNISASTGAGNVLITDSFAECIQASSGAGNIVSYKLKTNKGKFSTGAGKINFDACDLTESIITAGAGSIRFTGTVNKYAEFTSSLGKINVDLTDRIDNYCIKIYSRHSFSLNGQNIKISDVSKRIGNTDAENRIRIFTNFGAVNIKTNEGEKK